MSTTTDNTVWVKLHDRGGCFLDPSQPNGMVAGEAIVELVKTPKVTTAIRGGHLDTCTKGEFEAQGKSGKAQAKAKAEADDADAEVAKAEAKAKAKDEAEPEPEPPTHTGGKKK